LPDTAREDAIARLLAGTKLSASPDAP
jgi:hypothetical protein